MANPFVGQICTISFGAGRVHLAVIAKVVTGTTVNLIVANDDRTLTWDDPSESPGVLSWVQVPGVAKGSGSGEWQEIVPPA